MFSEKQQAPPMTPQQQQVDKLKEIGSQMRQIREEKSISIDEIATKTRIQARLLVAIEEGNLDHLPEPVYVQGLIKQFAEALGLNGREYAEAFPIGRQTYTIEPSWRQLPAAQLRPLHLYLFYILLIVASVSGLSYLVESHTTQENAEPQTNQEQIVEKPIEDNNSPPQLASTTPPPEKTQEHPIEIKVSIKKDSWVRVTSDGEEIYEGILATGETQKWTGEEKLTLRAGNAGGVVVEYNQQSPTVLGESGEVKQVTYSPSN
ncbi:helix-turn-helix domain-containing protein [Dactylococcopsis salina]|uniref:Cytoskeleton protein RodZ-like C-terminal domain-containing protein n=1 Tax=Dactylococcopsis salina (strain PCC 8305) TaxID=13035 RepID=K9YS50_DACS8|nr:RodZ domain-containing protein [Dactylococcopsis salina]AFZ49694.1 hypothetical protein Dacsa_0966 [Dactylococcopsis salina PCC 8305]